MCRDGPDRLAAFSGVRKLAEPLRYALATHRSANCVLVHLCGTNAKMQVHQAAHDSNLNAREYTHEEK